MKYIKLYEGFFNFGKKKAEKKEAINQMKIKMKKVFDIVYNDYVDHINDENPSKRVEPDFDINYDINPTGDTVSASWNGVQLSYDGKTYDLGMAPKFQPALLYKVKSDIEKNYYNLKYNDDGFWTIYYFTDK